MVLQRAMEQRPEIHAADEQVKGRQSLVDLETARLFPDFGIVAGARYTEQTNASNPQSPFVYNPYHESSVYAALAVRGTGLGRRLMTGTLQAAWDAGCYKAMLMTGSRTSATHAFYRACGFSPDAKTAYLAVPPPRSNE